MKEISAALVKAQRAFAPALKTATNPHFKSKYVGLDGCIEAVLDALNSNGVFLSQQSRPCDSGVSVETVFIHESGEVVSAGILHVPASKQDAQGYGSAMTYARRYSLMAACGIAPEDDDGNAAASQQNPRATITPGQRETLLNALELAALTTERFCKNYGIDSVAALPSAKFEEAQNAIKEYADAKAKKAAA